MTIAGTSKATGVRFFNVTSETDLAHIYIVSHARRRGLNRWTCNCQDFTFRRQFRSRRGRDCKHIRHVVHSVCGIHSERSIKETPVQTAQVSTQEYRVDLKANINKTALCATVRARFAEVFLLFGESLAPVHGKSANEWRFVDANGETFTLYDGEVGADQVPGLYTFAVGAPSQTKGNNFAIWLSDQIYAARLSAAQSYIA